jgi:hypothetical protein
LIPDEQSTPPPAGHNRPPSPVEALSSEQRDAVAVFQARRDEIVQSAMRKQVVDRATAGDAGDIIRIASEVKKRIDIDRVDRSKPYRDAADAAKGVVDEFWSPVDEALNDLRARLKAWTDAEDERIAAQQREQEEAMNRMRAAAPATQQQPVSPAGGGTTPQPPAGRTSAPPRAPAKRKIRGDLGATVSTVEKAEYRVTDVRAVPDWIMATPTVQDAIISVVKSIRRHAGDIPGIERITFSANQIR